MTTSDVTCSDCECTLREGDLTGRLIAGMGQCEECATRDGDNALGVLTRGPMGWTVTDLAHLCPVHDERDCPTCPASYRVVR